MKYTSPTATHYVYKTTNIVTGKIYVGMHSTEYIFDEYLGSGSLFQLDYNKWGKSNYKKEILKEFSTRKKAEAYEKMKLNQQFVDSMKTLNISTPSPNKSLIYVSDIKMKILKSNEMKYDSLCNTPIKINGDEMTLLDFQLLMDFDSLFDTLKVLYTNPTGLVISGNLPVSSDF